MAFTQLLSLPSELLLLVFGSCNSIQETVRLSAVSHRLRQVWLQNDEQIVTAIFTNTVPAYKSAIALAKTEARLTQARAPRPRDGSASWMTLLEHNAKAASMVATGFTPWLQRIDPLRAPWVVDIDLSPLVLHEGYYILKEFALAYGDRSLVQPLLNRLGNMSFKPLRTLLELGKYIGNFLGEDKVEFIGIEKDRKDWIPEDELVAIALNDEWEFAVGDTTPYDEVVHARLRALETPAEKEAEYGHMQE